MSKDVVISVSHKTGVLDPVGHGLKKDIQELGLARVKDVSSAQLYKIEGQATKADQDRIAKDLLCDPIIQDYVEEGAGPSHNKGEGIAIDVWFKKGVTDVVGDSVLKGIQDLQIKGVREVRTGMRYLLKGVTRREVAEKIALALLVNPLIHDSVIHVD